MGRAAGDETGPCADGVCVCVATERTHSLGAEAEASCKQRVHGCPGYLK